MFGRNFSILKLKKKEKNLISTLFSLKHESHPHVDRNLVVHGGLQGRGVKDFLRAYTKFLTHMNIHTHTHTYMYTQLYASRVEFSKSQKSLSHKKDYKSNSPTKVTIFNLQIFNVHLLLYRNHCN